MKSRYYLRFAVAFLFLCISCAVASAQVRAQDIQIGQTTNDVIEALGEPQGLIEIGTYNVMVYPRGEIVLRNGKVTSVALLTPRETAIKQEKWRRREAEHRRQQAEAAARARAAAQRTQDKTPPSAPGPANAARTGSASAPGFIPRFGFTPAPVAEEPEESEEPEMTEEEKRAAEIEQLKTEIAAAEQAEKDLSNVSYSVKRRRELRAQLADLEEEYKTLPADTEEEQAARELAAARIAAMKAEIKDLGGEANRIRRRREVRAKLKDLREKLAELEQAK